MLTLVNSPKALWLSGNSYYIACADSSEPEWIKLVVSVRETGEIIASERKKPDSEGLAYFYVDGYVDAFLKAKRDEISVDGSSVSGTLSSALSLNITLSAYDSFGYLTSSITHFSVALRGSSEPDTDYIVDYIADFGQILSFAPNYLPIAEGAILHFSYYNKEARPLKIMAQFTFASGAKSVVQLYFLEDAPHAVLHFAVPFATLSDLAPDFTVVEMWVRNAMNVNVSSVKSWQRLPQGQFDRYLVFENSVGGWDSIRTIGRGSENTSYSSITAESDNYIRNIHTEQLHSFMFDTGVLAAQFADQHAAANWIAKELLASRAIFLITSAKITELRAVVDDTDTYKDADFTRSMALKFEAVRIAKSFTTPALALPPDYVAGQEGYYEQGYIQPGYFN